MNHYQAIQELQKLKALYPNLTEGELTIAQDTFDRYLTLAWEILEDSGRIPSYEPAAHFSQLVPQGTIQIKVDSQQTQPKTNL